MQRGRGGPLTGGGQAVRRAGGEAVQPSLGTRPLRPRAPQGRGRRLGHVGNCGLALNTTPSARTPAPGLAEQAAWVVPGAPKWRAPPRVSSATPAPGACRHTVRRPTRPAISVVHDAPPSGSGGGERGAPGSGKQGADEAEDTASRLGRAAQQDVRVGRVRLREVCRQAASAGVREPGARGASDSGAPGPALGRCEAGPGARAPPRLVVFKPKPPAPTEPGPCLSPPGRAAWAGLYPKGQRRFSSRLAHCSGRPPAAALLSTSPPGRHLSTRLLSVLYFRSRPVGITVCCSQPAPSSD
jgi:hypothetical protein